MFEAMLKEVKRLRKLCDDNGIDWNPQGGKVSLGIKATVKVLSDAEVKKLKKE